MRDRNSLTVKDHRETDVYDLRRKLQSDRKLKARVVAASEYHAHGLNLVERQRLCLNRRHQHLIDHFDHEECVFGDKVIIFQIDDNAFAQAIGRALAHADDAHGPVGLVRLGDDNRDPAGTKV